MTFWKYWVINGKGREWEELPEYENTSSICIYIQYMWSAGMRVVRLLYSFCDVPVIKGFLFQPCSTSDIIRWDKPHCVFAHLGCWSHKCSPYHENLPQNVIIHMLNYGIVVARHSICSPPKIIGFGFLSTALICQGESTSPELLEVFSGQMRVCGRLPKYQHALGSAGVDWQSPAARRRGWMGKMGSLKTMGVLSRGTRECSLLAD